MVRLLSPRDYTAEFTPYYDIEHGLVHVAICKGSWHYDRLGHLAPLAKPYPIIAQDSFYGRANLSSISSAQENVLHKSGAELFVYGKAYPPAACVESHCQIDIEFSTERQWQKSLLLFGSRQWQQKGDAYVISPAASLAELPLRYEYAFGGGDPKNPYALNPVGLGYIVARQQVCGAQLPQIEIPGQRITSIYQHPLPAGFGPLPSAWCGSSMSQRAHVAPPDQRFQQYFHGGEKFSLRHLCRDQAHLEFILPSIRPKIELSTTTGERDFNLQCDTVIIDTERQHVHMIWRRKLYGFKKIKTCTILLEH